MHEQNQWTFDGDYRNLSQVSEFWDEYAAIVAELEAAGQYPYNDLFVGRIARLSNAQSVRPPTADGPEGTAIYLLQCLRHLVEGHDRIADLRERGYRRITELPEQQRFADVAVFDVHYAVRRYPESRVVVNADHRLTGVLPKGKRTRGRQFWNRETVYVLD